MNKLLIYLILVVPTLAFAQAAETSAPVSPVATALAEARDKVDAGDTEGAVSTLEALAESGFTAVAAITGDDTLSTLEGDARFDALVADMQLKAYPCKSDPAFSEFDFWVGNWDVHLANGTFAGQNRVSREQKGCVLHEEWTSATGGTGSSVNFVDKTNGDWVQIWNDASGSQINIRGGLTEEGMSLAGSIHYVSNGTTLPFRGLWTRLPDGRVRQYFEQSNDGGDTWSPWFEGFYSRRQDVE